MVKNSIKQTLLESVRKDSGSRFQGTSTARIWHAPRLNDAGDPAVGYQPHRPFGPIVLAVEEYSYAEYLEKFQEPQGQHFIDPSEILQPLQTRDSLRATLEDPNRLANLGLTENDVMDRLQQTDKQIDDLESRIDDKKEAERIFAKEHVREFIVVNDGSTRVDYNANPDDWELVILGPFSEADYCLIKPAIGRSASEKSLTPAGQPRDEVTKPEQGQSIPEKVQRLRNFTASSSGACPAPFQQADGRVAGIKYKYPKDGDVWIGPARFNVKSKEVSFFSSSTEDSEFFRRENTGKISLIAPQLEFLTDPRAIGIGDFQENPVQTAGASNIVTPVPRFRPRLSPFNFVASAYNVIRALLDDLENEVAGSAQRSRFGLQHEVVDFNDFIPPGRVVDDSV